MSLNDDEERAPVLVVDDLPEKRLVFETILCELAQDLVFARSGEDALREVLKRDFAVILLDVNMPGIDGLETAALIRRYRRSAQTPIIFVTAYADDLQTARGYELGAVDYIMSPVLPQILRAKVRVFVDLHVAQLRLRRQAEQRLALAAAEAARRVAEEQTRRSQFLASASMRLAAASNPQAGARELLSIVAPDLAGRALLALFCDGKPPSAFAAGDDCEAARAIEPDAMEPELQASVATALEVGSAAIGDDGWAVPLIAGARPLGVLLLVHCRATTDRALIDELAGRAAISLERAELLASLQAEVEVRREAEVQLQKESRRKDEFLAMLSHELRNPLGAIRSAVELIRKLAVPTSKIQWAAELSLRQVLLLKGLINQLLDVARINEGKIALEFDSVNLLDVTQHVVESMRPSIDAAGHRFSLRLPDAPVWLRGDAERLAQVISNLLGNATKYTRPGGNIRMELQIDQGDAVLSVADDGVGIEAELLPHVFEPFQQGRRPLDRSQGGLGVGLTLVRRLVELHHGSVEASSGGSMKGSTFIVRLPCVHSVAATPAAAPERVRALSLKAKLLLVEDHVDAAQSLAMVFEEAGHGVKVVCDGAQALAWAEANQPQVVVVDIGLPGIDGFELVQLLRKLPLGNRLLIVAVSGYGAQADLRRSAASGVDAHYVKPVDPAAVLARIDSWLDGGGERDVS